MVHKFLPDEGETLGDEGEGNPVGETEGRLEGRVVGSYKECQNQKTFFFLQMKIFFFSEKLLLTLLHEGLDVGFEIVGFKLGL